MEREHQALPDRADRYFQENVAYAGLGRASVRSGMMLLASRSVNVFVQVATSILLARLLTPHDFGVVAMVTALSGIAPLILIGADAAIQKSTINRVEISSLFWINIAIGGTMTLLFAMASGAIAAFYGEPSLTGIALVSSLAFVVTAAATQHYALMQRAMEFRRIAMIDLSANVISSIVSILLALDGWGYWALALKPVLTSLLTVIGSWIACPWLPGRPRWTSGVKELAGFAMGVTGFTITDYLSRSADRVAIGYFNGAGPLGYFQNASLLYGNVLSLICDPMHNIAVSSLSKLRNDLEELQRSWTAAMSTFSFFSAPAFAVLAVTGQDFVVMLLGQKWAPVGPLLVVFAVKGIVHCIERTMGWLHVVAGRADRWMRWGLVSALVHLIALAAGLPFGPLGVALSYTVAMFGLVVPALSYAGRPLGIGARQLLRAAGPAVVAALCSVAIGMTAQHFLLADFSRPARFLVSAMFTLGLYLAVVVGVFRVVAPLKLALSLLRDYAPLGQRAS